MANTQSSSRLSVLKTYKLYIGGQFPRTESGRYYTVKDAAGKALANACLSSRKDLRDAVSAARAAGSGWSGKTAFNRGQILYRMAEVIEARRLEFIEEIVRSGSGTGDARKEVAACIETLIHYAGWCDKYQQLFSSVNPVASAHFNFSVPEPTGVVAIVASQKNAVLGLVQLMAPAIAGGNTCVVVANTDRPLPAITLAEALATSDLPGGVVNILTGKVAELLPWMSGHYDVNALVLDSSVDADLETVEREAANNLKRVIHTDQTEALSPYRILDTQEIKTTWHPIDNIAGSGAAY